MKTAEITYNGEARTNHVGSVHFKKGRTETVTDPILIKYCQDSKGFSVQMLKDPPPPPVDEMPRGEKAEVAEEKAPPPPIEEEKASAPPAPPPAKEKPVEMPRGTHDRESSSDATKAFRSRSRSRK